MDKYCQLAQIGYQQFEKVVDILGGKWKLRILYFLGLHRVLRYSELKKLLTPNNICYSQSHVAPYIT